MFLGKQIRLTLLLFMLATAAFGQGDFKLTTSVDASKPIHLDNLKSIGFRWEKADGQSSLRYRMAFSLTGSFDGSDDVTLSEFASSANAAPRKGIEDIPQPSPRPSDGKSYSWNSSLMASEINRQLSESGKQLTGEPVDVYFRCEAIDNAASYQVVFNKRAQDPQTELSFTVPAEDIAALKAGLYTFTVQALPREGDIYYVASDKGAASFAIQPKGGEEQVEVTLTWDFSDADWQDALGALGGVNTDITNIDITVNGLQFHSGSKSKYNTTYIQFGGKSGDMDRYFKFTAPEQGTLKVTSSNTGSSAAMDRTVAVTVGEDSQAQAGGFGKATPGELEFSIPAGEVVITAPENGLCFYHIYYTNQ